MELPREFLIEVIFERRDEHHYYIHSPDLKGLHLMRDKLDDSLNSLLETVIKDLFWHNSEIVVDHIRWVPRPLKTPEQPGVQPPVETRSYVVNVQHAA